MNQIVPDNSPAIVQAALLLEPASPEWDQPIPYAVVAEPPPANEWNDRIQFTLAEPLEAPFEFCRSFVLETPDAGVAAAE